MAGDDSFLGTGVLDFAVHVGQLGGDRERGQRRPEQGAHLMAGKECVIARLDTRRTEISTVLVSSGSSAVPAKGDPAQGLASLNWSPQASKFHRIQKLMKNHPFDMKACVDMEDLACNCAPIVAR